jgi:hypothetical protein
MWLPFTPSLLAFPLPMAPNANKSDYVEIHSNV